MTMVVGELWEERPSVRSREGESLTTEVNKVVVEEEGDRTSSISNNRLEGTLLLLNVLVHLMLNIRDHLSLSIRIRHLVPIQRRIINDPVA